LAQGTARERSSATTSVQKLVQVQDEVVAEGAPYERYVGRLAAFVMEAPM
jgi:hypothetical protein